MLSQNYIAFSIVAVGIFTIYMAIIHLFKANKLTLKVRSMAEADRPQQTEENKYTHFSDFCTHVVGLFNLQNLTPRNLPTRLTRAGINSPNATNYYLFCRYVLQPLALLMAIYSMYRTFFIGTPSFTSILTGLIITGLYTLAGLKGTELFIENRKSKRHQALNNAFPEMLDLLLVCIESGLGLDAALNRICKEMRTMYPEMISELDRTRLELTMLNDRVIALQNLADRTEIIPFRTLVSSLIQTEKFGTSLVETLRLLAEELRANRLYTAEQKASRIPVLITLPLIICILPAFIMIIVGPPIVRVINNGGILGSSSAVGGNR